MRCPIPTQAIRYALLHPENADPLFAQLNPNMRVTIAIDDISLPLPQMRRPDIRERLLNQVLQTLADYGVDDVHLIIATSLHRRMTEARNSPHGRRTRLQTVLARSALQFRRRKSRRDRDDGQDRPWRGSLALASAPPNPTCVIYLNINLVPMDGGHKSVAVGLSPYQSLRHHHNPATLRDSHSYMDPNHSALHRSAEPHGAHRSIRNSMCSRSRPPSTTNMYGGMLDFLHKNEDRFTDWDRVRLKGFQWTLRQPVGRFAPPDAASICGTLRHDRGMGGRDRGGASARRWRKFFSNTRCR